MAKATRGPNPESNISRRRQNARSDGSEDYAAKRAELIAIAASLFREKGYDGTTLADIGERAGLDRATVYYYVGSKAELFQSSHEGILDDNLNMAERLRTDKQMSPREKLRAFITHLMKSYEASYPQMFVYIQEQMHQVAKDPSPWAKEVQRKTRRIEAVTRELVEQGVEQGKFRNDLDVRVAVKGLFGMLNWTSRWYTPGSSVSAEKIAETFCKIFFEGVQKRG